MAVQKFTNSSFFTKLEKLSDMALVNFLWIICSLPVVTLPIATAGLFAASIDGIRGRDVNGYQQFFPAMRRFWARSLQIAAIDLVIGLLATANVIIVSQLGMPPAPGAISLGITAFVAAMTLAANLYIWTLMVAFDLPIRDLIQTSLRMVFVHPAWTLMMLALALVVLLIGVTAPAVIWIFALFSGCAWLVNRGAWQVIRQYEDDLTH